MCEALELAGAGVMAFGILAGMALVFWAMSR